MTMRLVLVGIKKVEFKDGGIKYKHMFISERERMLLGWGDDDSLRDQVIDIDHYDDARARVWNVEIDERDGKVTHKVIL